jgi:amylosucrase
VVAGEPVADRTVFLARARRHLPDLRAGLAEVYGEDRGPTPCAARALGIATAGFLARPADLRLLDLRRHVDPDWFQRPDMLGYAAYTERFAGDLAGVAARIPYLRELGVTYLHLMPLLAPRPAPNDGGYAVADFRRVREDLGTMDDLAALAGALRAEGISLTLDLVLNHVAREHPWAAAARAGDEHHRAYFHLFPDRTLPDAHEATLPEVFPDFAPGSFTWDDELAAWVWTTFNAWQWDLDWGNPDVFCELADVVCFLANQGVECLRLDAIAFLWKRLGTTSQNQPEVHALIQALRAVARIAAPALAMKAEAIVGPDDLLAYLGTGRHHGKLSDLAYHNALMVHIWSAHRHGRRPPHVRALRRFAAAPATAWATYLRGHDEPRLGHRRRWTPTPPSARWDGAAQPAVPSPTGNAGEFPGSPARGLVFQHNVATGDRPDQAGRPPAWPARARPGISGTTPLVDEAGHGSSSRTPSTFGEAASRSCSWATSWAANDHGNRDRRRARR